MPLAKSKRKELVRQHIEGKIHASVPHLCALFSVSEATTLFIGKVKIDLIYGRLDSLPIFDREISRVVQEAMISDFD